jgi:DNA-directed RNA polymerase subunit RPC12/RpoP
MVGLIGIAEALGVVAKDAGLAEIMILVGAFYVGVSFPHFGRVDIKCDKCGRINKARKKSFIEGDTFNCKRCGKPVTFTVKEPKILETLAEKRP